MAGHSKCLVIGNEGGFLTKPVAMPLNKTFDPITLTGSLLMGPAERLDVVIDFSGQTGKSFILYTDTPAPFPVGDPVNDFLPNPTPGGRAQHPGNLEDHRGRPHDGPNSGATAA